MSRDTVNLVTAENNSDKAEDNAENRPSNTQIQGSSKETNDAYRLDFIQTALADNDIVDFVTESELQNLCRQSPLEASAALAKLIHDKLNELNERKLMCEQMVDDNHNKISDAQSQVSFYKKEKRSAEQANEKHKALSRSKGQKSKREAKDNYEKSLGKIKNVDAIIKKLNQEIEACQKNDKDLVGELDNVQRNIDRTPTVQSKLFDLIHGLYVNMMLNNKSASKKLSKKMDQWLSDNRIFLSEEDYYGPAVDSPLTNELLGKLAEIEHQEQTNENSLKLTMLTRLYLNLCIHLLPDSMNAKSSESEISSIYSSSSSASSSDDLYFMYKQSLRSVRSESDISHLGCSASASTTGYSDGCSASATSSDENEDIMVVEVQSRKSGTDGVICKAVINFDKIDPLYHDIVRSTAAKAQIAPSKQGSNGFLIDSNGDLYLKFKGEHGDSRLFFYKGIHNGEETFIADGVEKAHHNRGHGKKRIKTKTPQA